MKFLADECCDLSMVIRLRENGHDVVFIPEMTPGITDSEVLEMALQEKRVVITEDKDFGELIYRLGKPAFGVVLLRFHPLDQDNKIDAMSRFADQYSSRLRGNLVVIRSNSVRVKPLRVKR
jgi:predicted nuclease of predicted toxin-antitoxin system